MQKESAANTIQAIRWFPYSIPFRRNFNFTTAHGILTRREGAILEVQLTGGLSGTGEIAPLPEFPGPDLAHALHLLSSLATELQDTSLDAALQRLDDDNTILPSVRSGLELALLDILGKLREQSLATLLQPNLQQIKTHVPVNAIVGASAIQQAILQAQQALKAGFSCVKLKMVGDEKTQIARVAAIREAVGPAVRLRLDANEGWSFEQARAILQHCERYDIQYVEQPLPATDIAGVQTLQQETSIPLAADEAVTSLESARALLVAKAARVLILKPQLLGGLRNGLKIIEEAAREGVSCVITSSIESGIGLTGALHLAAASPHITQACGLATLELLEDSLLLESLSISRGMLAVPEHPGLGVTLNTSALQHYAATPQS